MCRRDSPVLQPPEGQPRSFPRGTQEQECGASVPQGCRLPQGGAPRKHLTPIPQMLQSLAVNPGWTELWLRARPVFILGGDLWVEACCF